MDSIETTMVSVEFILLALPKVNRLLLSREVRVELKESWNLLAQTQIAAQKEGGENRKTNSMLSLLNEIRIFFQKNPNADF